MTSYSAALKRFWWVVVLAALLGFALAVISVYRVAVSFPPKLTEREHPTYSAGTQLEVTSRLKPYYRTAIDVPVVTATPATSTTADAPERPTTIEQAPEVSTLVNAANYYPYVIEGDAVKALRERLYGKLDGEISATAIGATITPSRQEPGKLPFIQLIASSDSPQHAIDLAQQTADAFIRYVQVEQDQPRIRPNQRLIIKQIRKPSQTFAIGGTSLSLPMLIFVAMTLVGVAIAFLLDRIFPRPVAIVRRHDDEADGFRRGRPGDPPVVAASGRRDG